MPDERVILQDGSPVARVELADFQGEMDLYVARAAAATLERDGVLLREGMDVALVRRGGVTREVPLFKRRADGTLARVRVKSIAQRQR